MKIQERNGQFTVTLPKDIIELLQWKKNDLIVATTDQYRKDLILVRKV